jgi:hypothetical protein
MGVGATLLAGFADLEKSVVIYFIKDTVTQAIKIGHSKRPKKRIGSLQTGNPSRLILLGMVAGTEADEVTFHVRFAQYRLEGEWFNGNIIEEVLAIISEHKERRLEIRRLTMIQTTPESDKREEEQAPSGDNGTLDKDTGIRGVCRIPGLKLKSLSVKLTERPYRSESEYQKEVEKLEISLKQHGPMGRESIQYKLNQVHSEYEQNRRLIYCGLELKYVLEFEKNVTNDNATAGTSGELNTLQQGIMHTGFNRGLRHAFHDEDNAMIPFLPTPTDCHIVGGTEAITGGQGDAFRVLVVFEKMLNSNHHQAKMKDVFMGENYTGEHPLKRAKKLVISLR